MLIQNVHIENQESLQSIRIENGIITAIEAQLIPHPNEQVIDGHGQLALPPFVDPHVHLDSTLTPASLNGMNLEPCLMAFGFGPNAKRT